MNEVVYLFAGALALTGILTSISIWAPRRARVRIGAMLVAALFIPLGYASLADLLSRPKPVALEWLNKSASEATVLSATFNEGVAIYLWLQMPESSEPRSYALPWNRDMAQQLQSAQRDAEQNGGGLRMRAPFEPTFDDREPKFYAAPQPALPPKDQAPPAPGMQYRHPSTEA